MPDPLTATRTELVTSLTQAQLQIGELTAAKKDLEQKVAALTAELTALRGNKTSRKTKNTTIAYDDVLRDLGKKFGVTNELWLDTATFSVPLADTADDDAENAYEQSTVAALHRFIPQKYHDDMVHLPEFARLFCGHLNAQRSTGIHTVGSVAPTIFDKPQKIFARKYPRDQEPDLVALLKYPGDTKYTMFAPILYPPGKTKEPKYIFRSKYIAQIIRAVLFGESSLANVMVTGKAVGKIWGIKKVDAASVSMGAVYGKYIVSADTQLLQVGDKTKIPYGKEYRHFKELITSKANTSYMKDTIAFLNKIIFAGVTVKANDETDSASDDDDEFAAMLDKLNLDDIESPIGSPIHHAVDHPAPALAETTTRTQTQQRNSIDAIPGSNSNATAGPSRPRTTTQSTSSGLTVVTDTEIIVAAEEREERRETTTRAGTRTTRRGATRGGRSGGASKGKGKAVDES